MDKGIREILIKLNEEFYGGFKVNGEYVEIFKNPSKEEIRDVANDNRFGESFVRFLALYDIEDLYIWSADILHDEIDYKLDFVTYDEMIDKYFSSHGSFSGSEILIEKQDLDDLYNSKVRERICREIIDGKYDWLSRYYFNIDVMKESAIYFLEE